MPATTNSPPSTPTSFDATASANQVAFTWSGASDAETAEAGLRYLVQVGTTSGGSELMSRVVDPQNAGLLQQSGVVLTDVPAGSLYWRVRSIDATLAHSPWSAQQTLSFPASLSQARVRIAAVEGGTCSPGAGEHLVASGDTLQLAAQPAAGWQFDAWLVNGTSVNDNPYTLNPSQLWVDVVPQFSEKGGPAPQVGEWSRHIAPYDLWYTFGFVDYSAVALNGHLYCFPGYGNSSQTWRTSDGQTWQRNDLMGQAWFTLPYADAVVYGGKIWLVADAAVYSATQAGNGSLTWSTVTTTAPWGATHMEVAVFAGKLWAINAYDSDTAGSVWSSSDGVSWTQEAAAPWPNHLYKRLVTVGNKLLTIVSTSSFGTNPGEVWGTTDGVNWTQHSAATPWEHNGSSSHSECYIAAAWFDGAIHVVGRANTHFVSTDEGVSWLKVHPTGSESSHFTPVSAYGCELVEFNGDLYLMGNEEDEIDFLGGVFWRLAASSGGGNTTYALNISITGEGGSTMPPAGIWYDEAGSYPLEARPDPGYVFVAWSGPVASTSSQHTSVQLDTNVVVVAEFRQRDDNLATPASITLTATVFPAGSGRVELAGAPGQAASQVLADGSTEIVAIADTGWEFSHWLGDGVLEILSPRTPVIPSGAALVEVTACFRPQRAAVPACARRYKWLCRWRGTPVALGRESFFHPGHLVGQSGRRHAALRVRRDRYLRWRRTPFRVGAGRKPARIGRPSLVESSFHPGIVEHRVNACP